MVYCLLSLDSQGKVLPSLSAFVYKRPSFFFDKAVKIPSLAVSCFAGTEKTFTVALETVLSGHEGWVYSVHWCPVTTRGKG